MHHSIQKYFSFCGLTALTISLTTILPILPIKAAETIQFIYSPASLSIQISSLETFARTGQVNEDLQSYMNLVQFTEAEKTQFQAQLLTPAAVNPERFIRILNTDEANRLLNSFGRAINIEGGGNGADGIREAMVKAVQDADGLTVINVLRQLPANIEIDLRQSEIMARNIELVIEGTRIFTQKVATFAATEAAAATPIDFDKLPDIRLPGTVEYEEQTWRLEDSRRQRSFYVKVYQPQSWQGSPTPVVIISHGLNARPEDFTQRAQHLASYGYFVALPQHPGSDTQQTQQFRDGKTNQLFELNEFIDRPLDIQYTLDELERRNRTDYQGRLDLENVGLFGHSFGGYTALAIAGASLNFNQLETDCGIELGEMNTALLLQCRALQLEPKPYHFRDQRVKAVFAANPVNASIFGSTGLEKIQIPVFIGAGSYDPATPFLFEQVRSFPWLTTAQRYLQLQEGQAHVDFSQLDGGMTELLNTIPDLTLPTPQLLNDYTNPMVLAFFAVYLNQQNQYRPYLQPAYLEYLSQGQPFESHLITKTSTQPLQEAIDQFKADHNLK